MDNLKDSLRRAIDLIFNNWTGLEIAARESGNRNSGVIIRRLLDTIIEIIWGGIVQSGGFDNDVMVDLLVDTLYHQFDTICEDDSAQEIVGLMDKMANCVIKGEDPLQLPEIKGLRHPEKWIMEQPAALTLSRANVAPVAAAAIVAQESSMSPGAQEEHWQLFERNLTAQLVALRVSEQPIAEEGPGTARGAQEGTIAEEDAIAEEVGEIEVDEEDDSSDDDSSAYVGAGEGAGRATAARALRAGAAGAAADQDSEAEPAILIGAGEAVVVDPSDAEEEASSDGEGFHPGTPVSSSSEESEEGPVEGEAQGDDEPLKATADQGAQKEGARGAISKSTKTPEEMAREVTVIFMRNPVPKRKRRTYHRYTPTPMDQSLVAVSGWFSPDVAAAGTSASNPGPSTASFAAPDDAQGGVSAPVGEAPDDAHGGGRAPDDMALDEVDGNDDQEAGDSSGWEDVKTRKRK